MSYAAMFEARPLVDYCVSFVLSNLDVFLSTTLELKQHMDRTASDVDDANAMLREWVDAFKNVRDGHWHDDTAEGFDHSRDPELPVSVADLDESDSIFSLSARFDVLVRDITKVS